MGKVISYIGAISEMDFQKDVILIPYYLGKWLKVSSELYYGRSTAKAPLTDSFRNVSLHCIDADEGSIKYITMIFYTIWSNAKVIEYLVTFHLSLQIILLTFFLKIRNKKAKVWVLGDLNRNTAEKLACHEFVFSGGIKGIIKKKIINKFFNTVDIFSLETTEYYTLFKPIFEKHKWNCLTLFPCGWDEDNLHSSRDLSQKEDVILSCARFGTHQKNTEMLLEGLAMTDLKDWKVYLVGPITSGFNFSDNNKFLNYLEDFYKKYPKLKDKIIFTGPIFDTKKLFSFFKRAKIFIMTSRYEGFANVFSQARWNKCFILSTDVGGAKDMSDFWQYGRLLVQESPSCLSHELALLINHPELIIEAPDSFSQKISYNYLIPTLIIKE